MRRTTLAAALATALVTGTAVAATAAAGSPGASRPQGKTLRFGVRFSPFFYSDVDGNGRPSLGDTIVFSDSLVAGRKRVGRQGGTCPIVSMTPVLTNCTGTIALAGGQITIGGLTSQAPRKALAVTGGTGRYRDARGEVTLVEFGDDRGSLTVHLLP